MQSFSSRIWTRVAVSISYDDNRYTTGTSYYIVRFIYMIILWSLSSCWLTWKKSSIGIAEIAIKRLTKSFIPFEIEASVPSWVAV